MASSSALVVVTTCSERKRLPVPAAHQLRNVGRHLPLADRARAWTQVLEVADAAVAAADLYAGNHWYVARGLPALAAAKGYATELWIASAGYGLVPSDARLAPYAATFSPTSPDAIASGPAANASNAEWWHCLNEWRSPHYGRDTARCFAELARSKPDATFLVAASTVYLHATSVDLVAAASALSDRGQLLIVCTGPVPEPLRHFAVPANARLQHVVGGSRQALNSGVARLIINDADEHHFEANAVRARLSAFIAASPDLITYDRSRLNDDQLRSFIRAARREDPSVSKTRLLRILRDTELACEQKRFGQLFAEVVGGSR